MFSFQVAIWSTFEDGDNDVIDEGTLPTLPNLHHIVGMLVHVEHVHQNAHTLVQLACQLGDEPAGEMSNRLEKLSLSNGQVALCCNELAASLLTVIKSAPCAAGKELSSEVQSLSHGIARAGKNLNHLLKKRRVSRREGGGRAQPQAPPTSNPVAKSVKTDIATDSVQTRISQEASEVVNSTAVEATTKVDPKLKEEVRQAVDHSRLMNDSAVDASIELCDVHIEPMEESISRPSKDSPIILRDISPKALDEDSSDMLKSYSDGRIPADDRGLPSTSFKLSKSCDPLNITGLKYSETSNATGQVISESPSNSPPHQTHPQNGFSPTAPPIGHASDEEDSSVI